MIHVLHVFCFCFYIVELKTVFKQWHTHFEGKVIEKQETFPTTMYMYMYMYMYICILECIQYTCTCRILTDADIHSYV